MSERGSAAVELALVIPLALMVGLAMVQVGIAASEALAVQQAAREGAREAVVTTDERRVEDAALRGGGLSPERTEVQILRSGSVGDPVTVRVSTRVPLVVPFVRWVLPGEISVQARVIMRQEATDR